MKLVAGIALAGALTMCLTSVLMAQAAGSPGAAQIETQPVVSFQFDRVGLPVPRYSLRVREDGTGNYQADVEAGVASNGSAPVEADKHVERTFTLTPETTAKIFRTARGLNHFNVACASKAKNIANTGTKTLSYAGSDGSGSCAYNYSENKGVALLTNIFLGVAFTLDEGRRLDFLHRYDRLGLDAETTSLAREVESGHALELGTIAPTLTAIVDDTALMQRVRLRAAKMLEQANGK